MSTSPEMVRISGDRNRLSPERISGRLRQRSDLRVLSLEIESGPWRSLEIGSGVRSISGKTFLQVKAPKGQTSLEIPGDRNVFLTHTRKTDDHEYVKPQVTAFRVHGRYAECANAISTSRYLRSPMKAAPIRARLATRPRSPPSAAGQRTRHAHTPTTPTHRRRTP